jgi:hypothetical protein
MQSEASSWAKDVAARLWMLQTSFADDPFAKRQEFLVEEIERSLKEVAGAKRPEYLVALESHFPGWEQIGVTQKGAIPVAIEQPRKTAEELAEELLGRAAELSKERKAQLAERFLAVGLTVEPSSGLNLPPEVRGKLGLTPEQPLDEERLNKLFAALLEVVVTVDQLIWTLWKTIAPKSVIRRDAGENFRRIAGRYVTGDREVATLQISQMIDKTRQLFASVLSAIGPTGETYARHHLETFAPEKIRATVESGSSGFLSNAEQKCWRRYVTLANELTGPAIEKQIVDAIVDYTEEVVLGRKRG